MAWIVGLVERLTIRSLAGRLRCQPEVGAGYFSSAPLWGKPMFVTNAIGAGTAILGSFGQAAAVFNRGGPLVEATNSHEDWSRKDLALIRAGRRLAPAVYWPASFVTVTGLS